MADPLSITTGAFGIVAFAVQLTESIITVKKLCNDIKDAPRELSAFMEEIEGTSRMLKFVASDCAAVVGHNEMIERSTRQCWAALERLSNLVEEVRAVLTTRSIVGAFKMILKKDRLVATAQKLQQCKGDLHLAFTLSESLKRRHSGEELEAMVKLIKHSYASQAMLVEASQRLLAASAVTGSGNALDKAAHAIRKQAASIRNVPTRKNLYVSFPSWLCQDIGKSFSGKRLDDGL